MDSRDLAAEQPMPTPRDVPSVQGMVIADLKFRLEVGIQRYGTPLQPHNGRDMLLDAYEEAMDLCIYLKGVLVERGGYGGRVAAPIAGQIVEAARDLRLFEGEGK